MSRAVEGHELALLAAVAAALLAGGHERAATWEAFLLEHALPHNHERVLQELRLLAHVIDGTALSDKGRTSAFWSLMTCCLAGSVAFAASAPLKLQAVAGGGKPSRRLRRAPALRLIAGGAS